MLGAEALERLGQRSEAEISVSFSQEASLCNELGAAPSGTDTVQSGFDLIARVHGRGLYVRMRDLLDMPRIPVQNWARAIE